MSVEYILSLGGKKALKIQFDLQMLDMITAGKTVFLYKILQCNKLLPVLDRHFHVSSLLAPLPA